MSQFRQQKKNFTFANFCISYSNWIIIQGVLKKLSFEMYRGACGVMVSVVGYGHGDTSSNPGWDWLHFTKHQYPWERYKSKIFSLQLWVNSRAD